MGAIWGDFEVDFAAPLGRGGMGTVYRARQISLDREVALKVLDTSRAPSEELEQAFFDRFHIESRALAKLSDPRIVTVLQAGQNDGKCWYAMERIAGETVDDRLTRVGMLPECEAARVAAEVARALDSALRQGIVHRDVKPGNIFLLPDGNVKLGDFGLARSREFAPTKLTELKAVAATPSYCSPEQALGGESDHRGDIYSLGVVFYEMLTERPPFGGDSDMEVFFKHAHEPPPPMRAINPSLSDRAETVMRRCLEKQPDHRYRTYAELIHDLDAIAAAPAPATRVETTTVPVSRSAAPSSPLLGLAGIAGFLVFSFIVTRLHLVEAPGPLAIPSPSAGPAPLQHAALPSPEPSATPTPTPTPAESVAPDPHRETRLKVAALLEEGKPIQALELALKEALPDPPAEAARQAALRALDLGEAEAVARYAALVKDATLESEARALVLLREGRIEIVLKEHPRTRGEARALDALRAEFRSRTFEEVPLDGRQVWNDVRADGGKVDRSFDGGELAIRDPEGASWMEKGMSVDRGFELRFRVDGRSEAFGLFVSRPGGPSTGQAHGRVLFAQPRQEGTLFRLVKVGAGGEAELAASLLPRPEDGLHRVEMAKAGDRVILWIDGVALHHDEPSEADRLDARLRVGILRGSGVVTRIRVLR